MHNITVSGTTPTVNAQQDLDVSQAVFYPSAIYNPDTQRVNVHYSYDGGNKYLKIHSIDTSGTNPSSSYNISITDTHSGDHAAEVRVDYDTGNNKFLYVNRSNGDDECYARLVTDSGSAFTAHTRLALTSSSTIHNPTVSYDVTAAKFLVTYRNESNSNYREAIVVTYNASTSGTLIDKGTAVALDSRAFNQTASASSYDTNSSVTTVLNGDSSSTYAKIGFWTVKITGTTPSLFSSGVVGNTSQYDGSRIQMPRQHMTTESPYFPVAFVDGGKQGDSDKAYYAVGRTVQTATTNLDNNYLGVAAETISDTNTGKITVNGGVNENQTGLTIGDDYFSDDAGVIRTFVSGGSALTGGQFIGKAIAADKLLLEEQDPNIIYGKAGNAITAGDPIIVQTDGELSQVKNNIVTTSYTYSKGTEVELIAGNMTNTVQSAYDANADRFVVAYMDGDDSSRGKAIVVSTSNTTPSVAATGTFGSTSFQGENAIPVYDSTNNKVVIVYTMGHDSNKGGSVVATVGASSISFGSEVVYGSSSQEGAGDKLAYFDEEYDKIVLFSRDQSNSNYPSVYIGTVNGTSITWGSPVVIESSSITAALAAQYSSTDKKGLFIWEDSDYHGQAIVGTVDGTSMTFGSKVEFTTENISHSDTSKGNALCYDSVANKFLFLYQIASGDDGEGIVATISGTSVSFGSETNLHDAWTNVNTIGKSDFGKIPIIYRNASNQQYYAEVTITGTTPALSGEVQLNSGPTYFGGLSLDTTQGDIKLLATYEDGDNDLRSTVIIPNGSRTVTTPNLTTENFVGIAHKTATENTTAKVRIGGVDVNQSDLTAGQLYYVKNDGTLSTTPETGKSVEAGKALSATKLLVNTS